MDQRRTSLKEVEAWLRSYLRGGSRPAKDVAEAARAITSARTLNKAKANLGIESVWRGKVAYWCDPNVFEEAPTEDNNADVAAAIRYMTRELSKAIRSLSLHTTTPVDSTAAATPAVDVPPPGFTEAPLTREELAAMSWEQLVKEHHALQKDIRGVKDYLRTHPDSAEDKRRLVFLERELEKVGAELATRPTPDEFQPWTDAQIADATTGQLLARQRECEEKYDVLKDTLNPHKEKWMEEAEKMDAELARRRQASGTKTVFG
jgi:hypothetical protein